MSVDLQPAESFALATSQQRSQLITDRYGLTSEESLCQQLEQLQLQLIEAKSSAAPATDSATLYDRASKLVQTIRDSTWYHNHIQAQSLLTRHDLLTIERKGTEAATDEIQRLQRKLNISYTQHRQTVPSHETQLSDDTNNNENKRPSKLDEKELELDTLLRRTLLQTGNLSNFTQLASEWLATSKVVTDNTTPLLTRQQLSQFLNDLTHPVLSNIVDLVLRELNEPLPTSDPQRPKVIAFGETRIHRALTFEQLTELRKRKPDLWNTSGLFVNDWLLKDRPFVSVAEWEDTEENGGLSLSAKKEYLAHLWQLGSELPSHASGLRGTIYFHVLWYTMQFWQTVDMKALQTYLELPRSNAESTILKTRTDDSFGWEKLSAPEVTQRRAQLFAPGAHAFNLYLSSANTPNSVNIFNKCTSANEMELIEHALFLSMPIQKEDEQNKQGWIQYLNQEWLGKEKARLTLTHPKLYSTQSPQELDEYKTLLGAYETNRLKSQILIEFGRLTNKSSRTTTLTKVYQSTSEVKLPICVKNVGTMLVKIFFLNSRQFYTKKLTEIDAGNIELDGLTPKEEMKVEYEKEAGWNEFVIQEKVLDLPILSRERRGVYVVECYGAGFRTRCIIRKGSILQLSQCTAQGHIFKLVDGETYRSLEGGGSIYLNGQTYQPDAKSGMILIPYSATTNMQQKIVLMNTASTVAAGESDSSSPSSTSSLDTTFASLSTFAHLSETYDFSASFYIDRESLLSKTRASILIRPHLTIYGSTANLEKNLTRCVLRIDTTDDEGVPSTQMIDPFTLYNDLEAVHTFTVPDNLRTISCTLSGEIMKYSTGDKQQVSASYKLEVNTLEQTHFVEDFYLKYGKSGKGKLVKSNSEEEMKVESNASDDDGDEGAYSLFVYGKSGEPIRNRLVQFKFMHTHLAILTGGDSSAGGPASSWSELSTDKDGCIFLGRLPYITEIIAVPRGTSPLTTPQKHAWKVRPESAYVHVVKKRGFVVKQGESLSIPYTGKKFSNISDIQNPSNCVLIEDLGEGQLGRILKENISLVQSKNESSLVVNNTLKAGHYLLFLKSSQFSDSTTYGGQWNTYAIHVIQGERIMGEYLIEKRTKCFVQAEKPVAAVGTAAAADEKKNSKLQIVSVSRTSDSLTIHLTGVTSTTRLHLLSTNFTPEYSLLSQLTQLMPQPQEPKVYVYSVTPSAYMKQKLLGDEANYIMQRKMLGEKVGNLLPKPSFLLNERVKQDTFFSSDPVLAAGETYSSADVAAANEPVQALGGFGYAPSGQSMPKPYAYNSIMSSRGISAPITSLPTGTIDDGMTSVGIVNYDGGSSTQRHTYEFLSQPSQITANLKPDLSTQTLTVKLKDISNQTHNQLTIIAVDSGLNVSAFVYGLKVASQAQYDPTSTNAGEEEKSNAPAAATKSTTDLQIDLAFRDIRLMPPLDSSKQYTETHLITCLQKGQDLTIADLKTATVEAYDVLKDVWTLIQTLAKNANNYIIITNLDKFEWLMRWSDLSKEERDEKYSEFSCHELNLYLSYKDKDYFTQVIQPFLRNKLQKTFVDLYLLESSSEILSFLAPHTFELLNLFEKILLARYLHEVIATTQSRVKAIAILDVIIQAVNVSCPYNGEAFLAYFKTALHSKSLSAKDDGGDGGGLLGKGGREGREERANKAKQMAEAERVRDQAEKERTRQQQQQQQQQMVEHGLMVQESSRLSLMRSMAAPGAPPPPPSAAPSSNSYSMPAPSRSMSSRKQLAPQSRQAQMDEVADMEQFGGGAGMRDSDLRMAGLADAGFDGASFDSFAQDLDDSGTRARRLYQAPPTTKEYEERNWYDVTSSDTSLSTGLVKINRFWGDYAQYLKKAWTNVSSDDKSKNDLFITENLGPGPQTFTEVMMRLAVIDLPLEKVQHDITGSREKSMRFSATAPVILFRKELQEVQQVNASVVNAAADANEPSKSSSSSSSSSSGKPRNNISISCNYFDPMDLYDRSSSNGTDSNDQEERTDKYITDEFLAYKVYGARVVLTNISSALQKVEVLLQIPEGSMSIGSSLKRGISTTTRFLEVASYSSKVLTYLFYFPSKGIYEHYPPSITKKGVASASGSSTTISLGQGVKRTLRVRDKPSRVIRNLHDWKYLSQLGTRDELDNFLRKANLANRDLAMISWRFVAREDRLGMGVQEEEKKQNDADSSSALDTRSSCRAYWLSVLTILRSRLIYNPAIWSFCFLYNDRQALSEYLQNSQQIVSLLGTYFKSELISKDIQSYEYNELQYLEYSPLLNARTFTLRLGTGSTENKKLTIQNQQFSLQYHKFLRYLSSRVSGGEKLTAFQKVVLTYYLLLQDRIEEAKQWFEKIDERQVTTAESSSESSSSQQPDTLSCTLQYDYLRCYFAFFTSDPASIVIPICKKYSSYPIQKKMKLFKEVENQVMEFTSGKAAVDQKELVDEHTLDPLNNKKDNQDRTRELTNLLSSEPTLDWSFLNANSISITYENLDSVQVNFYKIHAELMFSAEPFMLVDGGSGSKKDASSDKSNSFLFVTPNDTLTVSNLPRKSAGAPLVIDLPEVYRKTNCWIEVTNSGGGGSGSKSAGTTNLSVVKPHFAHSLSVQITPNYGQVKVSHNKSGKPLPSTYIKVYCQTNDGKEPSFYKDGYTDLRGRFDYVSLSTDKLKSVKKFSILVLHNELGALVKSADPPQQ